MGGEGGSNFSSRHRMSSELYNEFLFTQIYTVISSGNI
jgi:hypothetical protein